MHSLTNFQKLLFILIIGISILFSNHLWKGDLLFHSDVARDFLVIDEIISTQKPTLIGPRSGGIPGVFHGPLWYYINTLPFFLSQGDPIVLGWFWWALAVLATAIFVTVTYKVSENLTVSLLAGLGFALMNIPAASGPINTYFADLFGYLVFVVWWKWLSKPSLLLASLGWLGFGLLIQFQMAFIVPISIIWLFFPKFAMESAHLTT